jgi:hypothetical protein
MGGYGSGRTGYRPVNDQSLALPFDRQFHRTLAVLRCQQRGIRFHVMTWRVGSRTIAQIGIYVILRADGDAYMVLSYMAGDESIREPIAIVWTATPFGRRPWWQCPGCARRCARLYNPAGRRWRCRQCYNVTYTSSNESDKRLAYARLWGLLDRDDLDTMPTRALILALRGHKRLEERWRRDDRQFRRGKPGRPRKQ